MTTSIACPVCGETVRPDVNFCGHCGARLADACPHCDHPNPRSFRFCGNCGRPLQAGAKRAERRLLTVLFADVEGFVAATAGLDPEAVADLMNRYFARAAEAITRFGGTVDKYMGDAVMALFGAPTAHEDDAERAIHAALAIQRLLEDVREADLGGRRVTLASRIGIATGEVLYGPVGTTDQPAMTALGEAVNLAARLESVAPSGGVLVSDATRRLTPHRFDFQPTPPLALRGFAAPITAFQVRGEVTDATSGRGLPGVNTSLVGRTAELEIAARAFASAERRRTTVLEISGDAGIGKSRLAAELVASTAGRARAVYGHSSPHDQVTAFGVVRDMLRALLPPGEPLPRQLDAGQRDVLSALLEVGAPARHETGRVTEEAAAVAGAALARLLVAQAGQPVIALFEDLHWADNASLLAIRALVEQIADAPLLIVLVSRPDYLDTARWAPRAARYHVALDPLPREAARGMLIQLVGDGVLTPELERAVLDRAAGNPFYLEELVRSLLDAGTLTGPPGERELIGRPTGETIPTTLRAVIAARIDRLAEADRLWLQQAAVLGSSFEGALLAGIAGDASAAGPLERLVASQLVSPEGSRPGWFGFKHPLVREVAYNTMSVSQRRAVHRSAAAALQKSGPPTERLGELLYHLERGEQWEQGAIVAKRAAEAARRLYAPREAIGLYGRAIAALESLGPSAGSRPNGPSTRPVLPWGNTLVELARVRMDRAESEAQVGDYPAALGDLQDALRLAGSDRALRAAIHGRLGEVRERTGDFAGALQALNAGIDELAPGRDSALLARLLSSLSMIYYQQGEVERAAAAYARALREVGAHGDHREISRAYIALNRPGIADPNAAAELQAARDALDAAVAAGDPVAEARLEARLGSIYARLRDFPSGVEHLRRSVAHWERLGDLANLAGVLVNLGVVEQSAGDLPSAAASLRRAAATFEQAGDQLGLARALARFGVLAGARGDTDEGARQLERAISLVESIGARERFPEYYRQLAELALAARSPEKAEQAARSALRWAIQVGNRFEEASAQRMLGLAAGRLQRRSEALGWLGESLVLFEKIGARANVETVRHELDALSRSG